MTKKDNSNLQAFQVILWAVGLMLSAASIAVFLRMSGIDFAILYAASHLSLSGHPELAYDVNVHHAALESILNRSIPHLLAWFYPPQFLMITLPLGGLGFREALYGYIGLTLFLFLATIYKIYPRPLTVVLTLGFPGTIANMWWGQNAFLIASILAMAIKFINSQPVLAGFFFSLLSFKPQYLILPMIALLVTRNWWTILWTLCFSVTIVVFSIIGLGSELWRVYMHAIPAIARLIAEDWPNVNAIQVSVYSTIRLLTGKQALATVCQTMLSIIVVIVVSWYWKKTNNPNMRGVVLVTGILLASPYVLQYDLALLAVPLALYARDIHQHGMLRYEVAGLVSIYFLPLINRPLLDTTGIQLTPLLMALLIVMACRRSRRSAQ